jgi:hypothetical protein
MAGDLVPAADVALGGLAGGAAHALEGQPCARVSVVIPARDEEATVGDVVEAIAWAARAGAGDAACQGRLRPGG